MADDDLTVAEAAEVLRTSQQTVRNYLRQEILRGRLDPGARRWFVDRVSIQAFLAAHGPLEGGRRRKSSIARLESNVERLAAEVARLSGLARPDDSELAVIVSERDDLRARVVALEDTLVRMREAAELQRSADAERDELVRQLLAAVRSANRTGEMRRLAMESLEEALAGSLMPGHASSNR